MQTSLARIAKLIFGSLLVVGSVIFTWSLIDMQIEKKDRRRPFPDPPEPILVSTPGEGFAVGSAKVVVKRWSVGKVRLKGGADSAKELLIVELSLTNNSSTKKIDYYPWQSSERTLCDDEIGNKYRRVELEAEGASPDASIYPGKSLEDVLIFEPPVAAARAAILTLPTSNIGGDAAGVAKFRLPLK